MIGLPRDLRGLGLKMLVSTRLMKTEHFSLRAVRPVYFSSHKWLERMTWFANLALNFSMSFNARTQNECGDTLKMFANSSGTISWTSRMILAPVSFGYHAA